MSEDDCDPNKIAENYVDLLAGEAEFSGSEERDLRQQAEAHGIAGGLDYIWALAGKLKGLKKKTPLVMPDRLKEMLGNEGKQKSSKVISLDDLEGLAAAGEGEKFDDL